MSITIIWQTKTRRNNDYGQLCIVCSNRIPPHSVAIRDMQNTNKKLYYHPACFMENRPRTTEEICNFWNNLHDQNIMRRIRNDR